MLPPTIAAFDVLAAGGKEVTWVTTAAATLLVCAGVSQVIVLVAFQALIDLNKALGFYVVGGDGCVKQHDPTGEKLLCFLGG